MSYRTSRYLLDQGITPNYSDQKVQCFCEARALEGDEPGADYSLGKETYKVCLEYYVSQYTTMAVSLIVMGAIIGINYLLKYVIIMLVIWIGYDTHSKKMT